MARALLSLSGLVVHLLWPGSWAWLTTLFMVGYAGFAAFTLYLHFAADQQSWPFAYFGLDTGFFFLCALHASSAALVLTLLAFFQVLTVGTLLYTWPHVALVSGLAFLIGMLSDAGNIRAIWPGVVVGSGIAILFSIYKDQLQERLSASLKRSLLSRSEAEIAREQERQRIAADFHDGPLQSFISFQMRLEILRRLLERDSEATMSELVQLQDLGRSQVTELRAFVRGMQPSEVTPQTLGASVREVVEHFERDSGITAQLYCGDLSGVGENVAVELLQIVREALNNVRKHSKASRVTLSLEVGQNEVTISVEDDGSGFPFSGTFTLDELEVLRLGPRSIKRRVRVLNGDMALESRPSAGALIRMRLPLSQ